jgi:hypothetical protein
MESHAEMASFQIAEAHAVAGRKDEAFRWLEMACETRDIAIVDLRGKRNRAPGYSSTSLTWIRGLLEEDYGVKPTDVEWIVSGADSSAKDSGGPSEFENTIPEGLSLSQGPEDVDESDLLAEGHVDALFHAAKPRAIVEGHPDVRTLFPDSRAVERDYYARTGIFPIMHAVAVQRGAVREHPGWWRPPSTATRRQSSSPTPRWPGSARCWTPSPDTARSSRQPGPSWAPTSTPTA